MSEVGKREFHDIEALPGEDAVELRLQRGDLELVTLEALEREQGSPLENAPTPTGTALARCGRG